MKRFGWAIASIMSVASFGNAVAADLPVKAPPPPPVVYNWTGFYAGINVGAAWGKSSWCTDATATNCASAPIDLVNQTRTDIVGGGQIGYRWQTSNWVIGVEGMYDALGLSQTSPSIAFAGRTRSTSFSNLASATGQVGYSWDRLLLFGKGGWATTKLGLDANNLNPGGFDLNHHGWVDGWTAGVGLEYLVNDIVSLGVQYNYYQFSASNITNLINSGGNTIGCAFCNFGTTNVQTATATLNFKLNWAQSVVAKF